MQSLGTQWPGPRPKEVPWKLPPTPIAIHAIAEKHGLSRDLGRWFFTFAHYGNEWLKTNEVGHVSQFYALEDLGLIKTVTTATIVTHWSDGSVTQAGYFGQGSKGEPCLTDKGAAIYVEMREAIAEGVT